PARQASSRGVISRMAESRICRMVAKSISASLAVQGQEQPLKRHAHHVVERPGEQDHQCLNDDDQFARNRGPEGKLSSALIKKTKKQRGKEYAKRMVACHQRDG